MSSASRTDPRRRQAGSGGSRDGRRGAWWRRACPRGQSPGCRALSAGGSHRAEGGVIRRRWPRGSAGLRGVATSWSTRSPTRGRHMGLTTPPCGTPLEVALTVHASRSPAVRRPRRRRRTRCSCTRACRRPASTAGSLRSQQAPRSPSRPHGVACPCGLPSCRAVWPPRGGRTPWARALTGGASEASTRARLPSCRRVSDPRGRPQGRHVPCLWGPEVRRPGVPRSRA